MIKKKKKKLNECKSINFILLKWFKNKPKPGVCKSTEIYKTLVKKHPILPVYLYLVCFLEYGHSVSQFEGIKGAYALSMV